MKIINVNNIESGTLVIKSLETATVMSKSVPKVEIWENEFNNFMNSIKKKNRILEENVGLSYENILYYIEEYIKFRDSMHNNPRHLSEIQNTNRYKYYEYYSFI